MAGHTSSSDRESSSNKKRPNKAGDDDDDDAGAKRSSAKKQKDVVALAVIIEPIAPAVDPCSPSYDIFGNANHQAKKNQGKGAVTWIIYLAVREPAAFAECVARCQSLASGCSEQLISRLQLDGTCHVTLWEGPMTQEQARRVCLEDDSELDFPIALEFGGWISRGAYLRLDAATETELKSILEHDIANLPTAKTKVSANHLSLYRARGMPFQTFNTACAKIREGVPAKEWGRAEGVSIRLKVMGSDYGHCRVLADGSSSY